MLIEKSINEWPNNTIIYTFFIILQLLRVSLFATGQEFGKETMSGSVVLLLLTIVLNLVSIYNERNSLWSCIQTTQSLFIFHIYAFITIFISPVPNSYNVIPKFFEVFTCYLLVSIVMWRIESKVACIKYLLFLCTITAVLGYGSAVYSTGALLQHTCSFTIPAAIGCLLALSMKNFLGVESMNYYIWINLFIIIMGTSSGSYIAFICGFLVYKSSTKYGVNILYSIFVVVVFCLIYYFFGDTLMEYIFYGKSKAQIMQATGRTYVWAKAMEAWSQNPILGCGFIVSERNLSFFVNSINVISAHNGYISILLGTGIVGCLIYGWFILKTIFIVFSKTEACHYCIEMTVLAPPLIVILVNNMSVHAIGSSWYPSSPAVFGVLALIHSLKYKK